MAHERSSKLGVTLKDIAREAGVSVTTVSLVLRKDPHPMISVKTRQKVVDVALKLKYRHNAYARALRTGKSQLIGLLMFDLDSKIAISKQETIDSAIRSRGYHTLLQTAAGHADNMRDIILELASSAVDGVVIIQPAPFVSAEMLLPLVERDIPIVTLEPIEGLDIDCITVNRKHGVYLGVSHLMGLGHRKIGLLHADASDPHSAPRIEGYRTALDESGIPVDESLLIETGLGCKGGYEAAKRLLDQSGSCTAIFCNDDEVAIGAMRAILDAGLRVPDDIAIVGFDDIEMGVYATVSLTTLAQPVNDLAERAVEILFKRLDAPEENLPIQMIGLEPRLVVRESCGALLKANKRL